MAKLVVLHEGNRVEYELREQPLTIGRLSSNDIQLHDQSVSKQHARVSPSESGSGWRIDDIGSSNGTFVDGMKVRSIDLRPNARIRCGSVELSLEDDLVVLETIQSRETSLQVLASMAIKESLDLSQVNFGDVDLLESSETSETAKFDDSDISEVTRHPAERKLQLIQMISEKTIKIFDTYQLADEILSMSMEYMQAFRGSICIFADGLDFEPLATRGVRPGEQLRVSRTVLQRLVDEKSGVLVRPDSEDDAVESLRKMAVTSTLCVPLWTTDRIMGFISLDRGIGAAFSNTHLDLMIAIAHQAAIGIERGYLAQLAQQESDARTYLSKYLDAKLVQEIANADQGDGADPLAPAEREVTVLFSDIVSFTKMSELMQPTELAEFIHEYLTAVTDIIFKHGGMIDKYIGDAVMALFGAPVANANAASNAINAALEMRDYVDILAPPESIQDPIRVRFGISTGKAVIGNIGSRQRIEYTAVGDTVNVASRLEQFARPSEICIDDATFAKVGKDEFAIQQIGAIDVKNRMQTVKVYKVLG